MREQNFESIFVDLCFFETLNLVRQHEVALHALGSYILCQFHCVFLEFLLVILALHSWFLNRGLSWAEQVCKNSTNATPSILNLYKVLCEESTPFILYLLFRHPHHNELVYIHRCIIVLIGGEKQKVCLFSREVLPQMLQNCKQLITIERIFLAGSRLQPLLNDCFVFNFTIFLDMLRLIILATMSQQELRVFWEVMSAVDLVVILKLLHLVKRLS
jgi:hypothetical protein